MSRTTFAPLLRTASSAFDAAVDPSLWPAALESLSAAVGAIGACYLIQERQSGRVELINFAGPCAELKTDYLSYYASLDPYTPRVAAEPSEKLLWLSQGVSKSVLRRNEWYNDFLLRNGIRDILGAKLFEDESHIAMFGLHRGDGHPPSSGNGTLLRQLIDPLRKAARLQLRLRKIGWGSTAAIRALDQLSAAVFLADHEGYVLDLNAAAERIVETGDGLIVRKGRLAALESRGHARLAGAISRATSDASAGAGRILIPRRRGRSRHALTVAPLTGPFTGYDFPVAMIVVVSAEEPPPSRDVTSGARSLDSRLAALSQEKRALEEALDVVPNPAIILSLDLRVLHLNAQAAALIGANDGLRLRRGRLTATWRTDQAALERLVKRADEARSAIPPTVATAVVRAADESAVLVRAYALTQSPAAIGDIKRFVLIFTADRRQNDRGIDAVLDVFGLTAAEQRLVRQLLQGSGLSRAARAFGLSVETVRTQIKRVYDKIGVRGQADLMRTLARYL